VKQILSWLGIGLFVLAGGVYIAGSAMVDFAGFRGWTKGLGNGAGIVVAVLFLIGGIFQVFAYPRSTCKLGK